MNEPTNPYASPLSISASEELSAEAVIPASGGRRFLNFVIDYIAQLALGFGVGVAIVFVFGDSGVQFLNRTPHIIVGTPILLAYYVILEATTSRTLGKLITGTKVVNEDGGMPSFGQILGRTFARMIPFEAFSFLGKSTRGWHDSLPHTYVVEAR